MAFNDVVEKFSRAPTKHKAVGLVLITAVFGLVFYFMFYSDLATQVDGLERKIKTLRAEKASYEEKQQKYNAFRAEVNKLLEEQKELVKVLPTDAEIPTFLQSLHAQGELAGLNILTFEQQPEVRLNFYAKIPVRMVISGTYHQINKFFYTVGQLKRIVNIQDVTFSAPTVGEQGVVLKASFVASTFRFIAPQTQPPGGAPRPPRG
jgi:type IV pilus assembly protein PilO